MSWVLMWLVSSASSEVVLSSTELRRNPRFNLRAGANLSGVQKDDTLPQICGELTVWKAISIEGCGNGSGFLHTRDVPDIAHFRAKWPFWRRDLGTASFSSSVGVGITEVQRSADAPGFQFGQAENGQVEAAGPEVSLGLSGRRWIGNHGHLILDVSVGVARVPGAVEVMDYDSPTFLFGSATLGVGF